MKNNKGYTLVELLVTLAVFAIIMAEVGSMMMNSSMLYRNGTYEVELQTEAQQIVQQMEELLIDVNHSVSTNYQPTLSSDFITISNNSMGTAGNGDYTIYNFTLDMDHPELGYGTLYFDKTCSDVSSNVTHVPMAEYVQSISLNMDQYKTSDIVTLNVSMNNGRYGYQASQDIYLRNAVGSGGGMSNSGGGTYNYDLDVLRFREYDLAKLYNTEDISFTFEWDSECATEASNVYEFVDASHTKLRTNYITNGDTGEHGYYTLIGTGTDPGDPTIKIRVSTKKVEFGTNGVGLMNAYSGTTMLVISAIPVQGIDVAEADDITMSMTYLKGPSTEEHFTVGKGAGSGVIVRYDENSNFAEVKIGTESLYWEMNPAVNSFEVYCKGFQANQCSGFSATGDNNVKGYTAYMDETGAPLCFNVTLEYNGFQTVTGQIYVFPYDLDMGDQASEFWGKVGW